jgi:signal transduction histidine kinase
MLAPSCSKVLVIEDDADTRANLRDILELDDVEVDTAGSMREAFSRADWSQYATILLDRKLPDGLAEEFLPQLFKLAPQAAVILTTGHADLDLAIEAMRQGVSDCLLKPVDPAQMRASLARVAKLQEAQRQLLQAERLAAIGRAATGIVHESRNALQRIQLATTILETLLEGQEVSLREVARIDRAVDSIRNLFEEMRSFAAPINLHRQHCNVAEIWRRAWRHVAALQNTRPIAFREELDCEALDSSADILRLEQVFRNLFENALAASPASAFIEVGCEEIETAGRKAIRVSVRDNGAGFAIADSAKAFEPFYTTKPQGTGLGLAIVKRIIEAHGGEVFIGPNRHPGAEVGITLPVSLQ